MDLAKDRTVTAVLFFCFKKLVDITVPDSQKVSGDCHVAYRACLTNA